MRFTAEELAEMAKADAEIEASFREEIAAKKKAYREANREEIAARQRAYREAHRGKLAFNSVTQTSMDCQ